MAATYLFLLTPLLLSPRFTEAHDRVTSKFNPTKAILIASVISFVILVVIYLYSRFYHSGRAAANLSSRRKGLSQTILNTFPTILYSDIKSHKIGKSALECAICLNEFEDEDSLRLLPRCSHVFHEDCIDAWLSSHVTCPVCRDVLEKEETGETITVEVEEQRVVMQVEDEEERINGRRNRRGGMRSLMRSHTTGHINEDWERYTLRLPESVRNDIIVARMLKRESSLPVRGVKGGSNEGRTMWVGRLARWPSYFLRSRIGEELEVGKNGSVNDGLR